GEGVGGFLSAPPEPVSPWGRWASTRVSAPEPEPVSTYRSSVVMASPVTPPEPVSSRTLGPSTSFTLTLPEPVSTLSSPSKPFTCTPPEPRSSDSQPRQFSACVPPDPPSNATCPSTLWSSLEPAIENTDTLRPLGTRTTRSAQPSVPDPLPFTRSVWPNRSNDLEPVPHVPSSRMVVFEFDQRPIGG